MSRIKYCTCQFVCIKIILYTLIVFATHTRRCIGIYYNMRKTLAYIGRNDSVRTRVNYNYTQWGEGVDACVWMFVCGCAGGCRIMYNQLNLYVTPDCDRRWVYYTHRRGNGSDAVWGARTSYRVSNGLKSLWFIDALLHHRLFKRYYTI